MAFMAKILSWPFRHLNIVACLLKRRPTKGGSRAPQDPPSYAPEVVKLLKCCSLIFFLFAQFIFYHLLQLQIPNT